MTTTKKQAGRKRETFRCPCCGRMRTGKPKAFEALAGVIPLMVAGAAMKQLGISGRRPSVIRLFFVAAFAFFAIGAAASIVQDWKATAYMMVAAYALLFSGHLVDAIRNRDWPFRRRSA